MKKLAIVLLALLSSTTLKAQFENLAVIDDTWRYELSDMCVPCNWNELYPEGKLKKSSILIGKKDSWTSLPATYTVETDSATYIYFLNNDVDLVCTGMIIIPKSNGYKNRLINGLNAVWDSESSKSWYYVKFEPLIIGVSYQRLPKTEFYQVISNSYKGRAFIVTIKGTLQGD